jgi:hypothetical protein
LEDLKGTGQAAISPEERTELEKLRVKSVRLKKRLLKKSKAAK